MTSNFYRPCPYVAQASGGFFKFYFDLDARKWDDIIQRDEIIIVFSRRMRNFTDDACRVLTHRGLGWIILPCSYDVAKKIL